MLRLNSYMTNMVGGLYILTITADERDKDGKNKK